MTDCDCICHKWLTATHTDGGCCSESIPPRPEEKR